MLFLCACQMRPALPAQNDVASSAIPPTSDVASSAIPSTSDVAPLQFHLPVMYQSHRRIKWSQPLLNLIKKTTRACSTITVLYDNNPFDERLNTAWGFAALVEYQDQTLLFDTGGDGPTLLGNMNTLEIDPTRIQNIVLSHAHGDHTGGLGAIIEAARTPQSTCFLHFLRLLSASWERQPPLLR